MKEIRIGIIGAGMISHQHMERYQQIPNAKVVAVCDLNQDRLDAWCSKYQVQQGYTDYRKLLERDDLDAVDVCLHNNLHVPMALEVLRAGKHCYCEKPMAGSYADAKLLYEAAKTYGKELAVHLDFLFFPQSRVAKEMVDNGTLGRVYHARSLGYRRRMRPGLDITGKDSFSPDFLTQKWAGHGALYDMGVYHISQLLYILGMPTLERVSGMTYQEVEVDPRLQKDLVFQVEELGLGFAKYQNGLTLDIMESWAIHMDDFGKSFLVGSKGGLRIMDPPGSVYGGLKYLHLVNGQTTESVIDLDRNEKINRTADPLLCLNENDQTHWIAYLSGQLPQRIDTAWVALQTMLVSEGIFLSGKLGREVTADEIGAMSVSNAIRQQETAWGSFNYQL
ncbi:MAG: Gfo/Idh/MocA family oxidoreductase [Angelakisella sp.]